METIWWDKTRLLSFNKIFSFALGVRGNGKSYEMKKWVIRDFIKNGKQGIIVRRYKEELKEFEKAYCDDIRGEFPSHDLETKGGKLYVDGKVAGFFIPLSISMKYKSVPFPEVNKIIYEEFVIDKGSLRYLSREVDTFLEFYETVARLRDNVRAVFVANTISIINPYFLYWNIKINPSKQFTVKDHIVVELIKNQAYTNAKMQTRFGQMLKDTNYGKYAFEGEFLRDNDTFVEKKTPNSRFVYAIVYGGTTYGFWIDYGEDLMFISKHFDPSSLQIYSLTKDDHTANTMLIQTLRESKSIKRTVEAFQVGKLRFEDMQTKNQFYEYVGYFLR